MLNWGAVDRILWVGVLCLVTWCAVRTTSLDTTRPSTRLSTTFQNILSVPSSYPVGIHTYSPMKMEQTQCSETSTFKLQTPVNHPAESTQHSEHSESLKSRNVFTPVSYETREDGRHRVRTWLKNVCKETSHYRPGQACLAPGGETTRFPTQSAHVGGKVCGLKPPPPPPLYWKIPGIHFC
jgi:hypothetical protein